MNRRTTLKIGCAAIWQKLMQQQIPVIAVHSADTSNAASAKVSLWDIFEFRLTGPTDGNPFVDVQLRVLFTCDDGDTVEVEGFYDGDGVYITRFMPQRNGTWRFETISNMVELNGHAGSFICIAPSIGNHGIVRVAHDFHFAYADGTPYFPFGTTCYSFGFVQERYRDEVLHGLHASRFNKVRMSLLTKPSSSQIPVCQPFELSRLPKENADRGAMSFDTARFNPIYFRLLERRIVALLRLGIQADLILFYSHDALSYGRVDEHADERYIRYVVARFGAFRNVWWSMANEYDLITNRTLEQWNRNFQILSNCDTSQHLCSIHYSRVLYDYSKPWITHASLQSYEFSKVAEYQRTWSKPIIWDEMQYEGNIASRWGNLSAEEMTRRCWMAVVSGTYGTHGETYDVSKGANAWTISGRLRGRSPQRICFLKDLIETHVARGLDRISDSYYPAASDHQDVFLYYMDCHCPDHFTVQLPKGLEFSCVVIDTWRMKSTNLPQIFRDRASIPLPGRSAMAVLLIRH